MLELIPRIAKYNLFREFGLAKPLPTNITVTVTDICNFMCKTCNIGKLYTEHPEIAKNELSAEEYGRIFNNIGRVFWITMTGGEPFFRRDLADIAAGIYKNSEPRFMTIPTNGYVPKKIAGDVERILSECEKMRLIVNLSLDGLGSEHDEIRGMKDSFERVLESYFALRDLKNDRLSIGVNTVISKFNIDKLGEIAAFVGSELKPDSFIAEVAENRSNLYNEKDDIRSENYGKVLRALIRQNNSPRTSTAAIIRLARGVFYRALISGKPHRCFAGFASACIMPKGDVWLSCVKRSSIGNLRDVNYDFRSLWFSEKAGIMRNELKKPCSCMLANAHYTNLLCNPAKLLTVVKQ
ncbi:MAG: radical SAM protein [Candidatus Aenigmarchaeota archaeon]|nr:radical SAM protein [Candidatus Aenigmarchaeota archaeon]